MRPYYIQSDQFRKNRIEKTAINEKFSEDKSRTALIIGGGAPNSAWMAGALAAFEDDRISFDVISTSGAGGLLGLLWLSPNGMPPAEALRNWVNSYISDPIYTLFPINYKIFRKPGIAASLWRDWLESIPYISMLLDQRQQTDIERIWSDFCQLLWAAISPTALSPLDIGLCARTPWAERLIDFNKIGDIYPYFYMNSYDATTHKLVDFSKDEITPDHFRATMAFPYIYGPYSLNGNDYYEGAVRECLNFKDLTQKHTGLRTIVVLDVMGIDELIRRPHNLYDSWVLSMIIPLVKIAEGNLEEFAEKYNNGWSVEDGAKADLLFVNYKESPSDSIRALDWSYSNGLRLFKKGYDSAKELLRMPEAAALTRNSHQAPHKHPTNQPQAI